MDYTQKTAIGVLDDTAKESIESVAEEYDDINTEIAVPSKEKEVEAFDDARESIQETLDQGTVTQIEPDQIGQNPDALYTRSIAFKLSSGNVELETPESFEKAENTKERLAEIKMVNEELERQGHKRRYTATESDVPDNVHIYEDDFGKYYYKDLNVDLRPSDIASYADVKAIVALEDDEKKLKTVEVLTAMHPNVLIDADSKEAAEKWLNRHLVLTDDEPRSEDVFSHEFKSELAELIAQS